MKILRFASPVIAAMCFVGCGPGAQPLEVHQTGFCDPPGTVLEQTGNHRNVSLTFRCSVADFADWYASSEAFYLSLWLEFDESDSQRAAALKLLDQRIEGEWMGNAFTKGGRSYSCSVRTMDPGVAKGIIDVVVTLIRND